MCFCGKALLGPALLSLTFIIQTPGFSNKIQAPGGNRTKLRWEIDANPPPRQKEVNKKGSALVLSHCLGADSYRNSKVTNVIYFQTSSLLLLSFTKLKLIHNTSSFLTCLYHMGCGIKTRKSSWLQYVEVGPAEANDYCGASIAFSKDKLESSCLLCTKTTRNLLWCSRSHENTI